MAAKKKPAASAAAVGSGGAIQRVQIQLPPLFAWQQEVHDCPARYRVVLCARGIGKTALAVMECVESAMRGEESWWVAPSYKFANAGYDILSQMVAQPPFNTFVTENKSRQLFEFRQPGMPVGSVEIRSADDPRSIKGKQLDKIVLDEFSEMHPDAWYEGAVNTLAVKRGRALLIGNPPKAKNYAWDLYQLGDSNSPAKDPDWQSFSFSQHSNPYIPVEDIQKKQKTMPFVQYMREVMGQLIDDGGIVFRGVREAATIVPGMDPLCQYDPSHEYYAGLDLSGGGRDFSVIIVFDKTAMAQVAAVAFNEIDLDIIWDQIASVQAVWNPTLWEVENNAVGLYIPEFLTKRGIPLRDGGFNTNWKSKRDLIDRYKAAIELGQIRLLKDPELVRQHESVEMKVTANGIVQYAAPNKQHDDYVMAAALAYRAATVTERDLPPQLARMPYRGLYDSSYGRNYPSWQLPQTTLAVRRGGRQVRTRR